MKSFKEFQSELNQALDEKHKQQLKFRVHHEVGEQKRIVANILLSLEKELDTAIKNTCLGPVSAWESCHSFGYITKDDCKQIIFGSLSQIEFELIQLGYKFEADVIESNNGYQLTITLVLDVPPVTEAPVIVLMFE